MELPKVSWIHLELTNVCNFDCEFCPTKVSKRSPKFMPLDMFKSAVDNIVEHGLATRIQLHVLGEPLLYKDILTAVEHASSSGLKVMLTTNGSILTEEKILGLANAGLYSLDISLQLYDGRRHVFRKASIDFENYRNKILEAVAVIHKKTGIQLTVKLMNTKYKKLFSLSEAIELDQKGREFKAIACSLITDIYRSIGIDTQEGEILQRLKDVNLDSSKRIRLAENLFVFVQIFMDWGNAFCSKKIYPAKFGKCSFAFTAPSVLSDGTVAICCGDYDGGTRLGNIHDTPLNEILQSDEAKRLWEGFRKNRLLHPYCQRCFGDKNPLFAAVKGLGSILVFKFMDFEGDKDLVLG